MSLLHNKAWDGPPQKRDSHKARKFLSQKSPRLWLDPTENSAEMHTCIKERFVRSLKILMHSCLLAFPHQIPKMAKTATRGGFHGNAMILREDFEKGPIQHYFFLEGVFLQVWKILRLFGLVSLSRRSYQLYLPEAAGECNTLARQLLLFGCIQKMRAVCLF